MNAQTHRRITLFVVLIGVAIAIGIGIGISVGQPARPVSPSPPSSSANTPPPATATDPIPTELGHESEDWDHYDGLHDNQEFDHEDPDPPFANLSFDHWVLSRSPNDEALALAQEFFTRWNAPVEQDQWIASLVELSTERNKRRIRPLLREFQTSEHQTGAPVQRSDDQTGEDVIQVAIPTDEGSWVATIIRQGNQWRVDDFTPAVSIDQLTAP